MSCPFEETIFGEYVNCGSNCPSSVKEICSKVSVNEDLKYGIFGLIHDAIEVCDEIFEYDLKPILKED